MIVGTFQLQLAQYALEALRPPTHITGRPAARARLLRPRVIAGVGIEPLLSRPRRQPERAASQGNFQRLEVEFFGGLRP